LANDGARVFSVDIESIQVSGVLYFLPNWRGRQKKAHDEKICCRFRASPQEYTKRPRVTNENETKLRYHPRHVVHPGNMTLQECLAISDVVVSAVPSMSYKVKTEWLKEGCICVNVAAEKNFEKDVRDKVRVYVCVFFILVFLRGSMWVVVDVGVLRQASIYVPAVGKVTILMLLRNL